MLRRQLQRAPRSGNEPQPDLVLIKSSAEGGQARISADDYLEGAPELAVEIVGSFAQSRCRMEFRFRTGHYLVHRIRAKVNAAGPFNAAEIGIDGYGVTDGRIRQFQEPSGSAAEEGAVFVGVEAATQGSKDGLHVALEQGLCVEPEAGENAAFEQAVGISSELMVFSFAKFPPHHTLLAGDPDEVLANAVAAVAAHFLVEVS